MKSRPKKDDAEGWRREALRWRKHLVTLTNANLAFFLHLDAEMRRPVVDRRKVAEAANILEMANDSARYFGLDVNHKTDKKKPLRR